MKQVTFLLIPGLNDTKLITKWFYGVICRLWSRKGWQTQVCLMDWEGDEPYEQKLVRVNRQAKKLQRQGREVVLVGVSAGATLAVIAFAAPKSKVFGVVTICGLLRLAPGDDKKLEFFHKSWFKAARACGQAATKLNEQQRARIVCAVPRIDSVISPKLAYIRGSHIIRLRSGGHLTSIFVTLVWYRRKIWHSLRQLSI